LHCGSYCIYSLIHQCSQQAAGNRTPRDSKEFELDAISLVEKEGYATTEAASSLGIRPELITSVSSIS
ncbi:MAG: hypothetical protein KZQ59_12070, partial [Candidatus Thiodiazotropha sp. (ex Lucinoma aequizonata)]|nr:hypothetical protein [Candidatus Thiodiazotropha sp. (ex Lucinoma aequizonata)]MCU7897813.1 hypothetical protein [Candidatus Thiodiazotropha sp. (ex Lucinoma aequizonata)]